MDIVRNKVGIWTLVAHSSVGKKNLYQLICAIIVPVWAESLDWKIHAKNET